MEAASSPVTILMPVKNGQEYLSQAIIDIEANLGKADEIIVVEDGSTDNTIKLLNSWKKTQEKLTVISTGGKGLVNALNLGISNSSYEWIARFDVDDRYEPNRIDIQGKLFNQDVAAIFCDYTFNSINKANLGWIPCAVTSEATAISLISSQRTPHPGVILNKSAVQDAGMYLSGDYPAEDLSLWLRLSKLGKLVGSPEKLLHYSLNPLSVSSRQRELALQTKERLLKEHPIDTQVITSLLENWEDSLRFYDTLEFSARRKALLIRDLRICKKRNLLSSTHKKLLTRIESSVFSDFKTYGEIRQLFFDRKHRAKFREFNQPRSFLL